MFVWAWPHCMAGEGADEESILTDADVSPFIDSSLETTSTLSVPPAHFVLIHKHKKHEYFSYLWKSALVSLVFALAILSITIHFVYPFGYFKMDTTRVGNILSVYAGHLSIATHSGRAALFVTPLFSPTFVSRLPHYLSFRELTHDSEYGSGIHDTNLLGTQALNPENEWEMTREKSEGVDAMGKGGSESFASASSSSSASFFSSTLPQHSFSKSASLLQDYCRYGHEESSSLMWTVLPSMRLAIHRALSSQMTMTPSHLNQLVLPSNHTCSIHLRLDDLLYMANDRYPLVRYAWYRSYLQDEMDPPCAVINVVTHFEEGTSEGGDGKEEEDRLESGDDTDVHRSDGSGGVSQEHLASSIPSTLPSKHSCKPAIASRVLFSAFVTQLKVDFPNAHVNAFSKGTIDEDFTTFVTSHLFLGSSSSFSLWAGVACLGRAHIPQSPLFYGGESHTLRHSPLLDLAPALIFEAARARYLVEKSLWMQLVEEMMRV